MNDQLDPWAGMTPHSAESAKYIAALKRNKLTPKIGSVYEECPDGMTRVYAPWTKNVRAKGVSRQMRIQIAVWPTPLAREIKAAS